MDKHMTLSMGLTQSPSSSDDGNSIASRITCFFDETIIDQLQQTPGLITQASPTSYNN